MSRIRINHSIFPLGKISPKVKGNVDIEAYNNSLQECTNFLPAPTGGLFKRKGTTFIVQLPDQVDNLDHIIIPYYIHTEDNKEVRPIAIIISALAKADPEQNYHEPVISFIDLEANKFIEVNDETFKISFKRHIGAENWEYKFPLCPSFEQFQGCNHIQNGNSIIIFSQYFPLIIAPSQTVPFSIRPQPYSTAPFSFQSSQYLAHPRSIRQTFENQIRGLTLDFGKRDGNTLKTQFSFASPPFYVSAAWTGGDGLYETTDPENPITSQFRWNENSPADSFLSISNASFGLSGARVKLIYQSSDPETPSLAWNGICYSAKYTNCNPSNDFCPSIAIKLIKEECPSDAATPDEIKELPGTNPPAQNNYLPLLGENRPQVTANWYISHAYLNSSNLPVHWQDQETADEKKVTVNGVVQTAAHLAQTREKDLDHEPPLNQNDNIKSGYSSFAKSVTLFEGRLFLANIGEDTNGIWGSSKTNNDWFDFSPGVNDGDGIREKIPSEKLSYINWICSSSRLFLGSAEGVYICGSVNSSSDSALTPGSFRLNLISQVKTSTIKPLVTSDSILFVGGDKKSLFEIILDNSGIYRSNNISMLADNSLDPGVKDNTWLEFPNKTYWAVLINNELRSMSYMKNNNIMAWAWHNLGANQHRATVSSIASINTSSSQMLLMATQRIINNKQVSFLEAIKPDDQNQNIPIYGDCSSLFIENKSIHSISGSKITTIHFANFNFANFSKQPYLMFVSQNREEELGFMNSNYLFKFIPDENDNSYAQLYIASLGSPDISCIPEILRPTQDALPNVSIYMGDDQFPKAQAVFNEDGTFELLFNTETLIENVNILIVNNNFTMPEVGINFRADYSKNPQADNFLIYADTGTVSFFNANGNEYPNVKFKAPEGEEILLNIFIKQLTASPEVHFGSTGKIILNCSADDLKALINQHKDQNNPNDISQLKIISLNTNESLNNSNIFIPFINVNNSFTINEIPDQPDKCSVSIAKYNPTFPFSSLFPTLDEPESRIVPVGEILVNQKVIANLAHLTGELMSINADLVDIKTKLPVADFLFNNNLYENAILLPNKAFIVYIGYPYVSEAFSVPVTPLSQLVGSTVGLTSYQKEISLMLLESFGGSFGSNENSAFPIPYHNARYANQPQLPYSGLLTISQTNIDTDSNTYYIKHDSMDAFNVLNITQEIFTSDDQI